MNVRLTASLYYSIFRDDRDSVAEMLTLFDTERQDRSARRFHDAGFRPRFQTGMQPCSSDASKPWRGAPVSMDGQHRLKCCRRQMSGAMLHRNGSKMECRAAAATRRQGDGPNLAIN